MDHWTAVMLAVIGALAWVYLRSIDRTVERISLDVKDMQIQISMLSDEQRSMRLEVEAISTGISDISDTLKRLP